MVEYTKRRNKNRGYMKLEVWHRGIELSKLIWSVTSGQGMDFKLRSQIVNAAHGIPSNIAEGYARRSIREYIQFLYIALGCLAEVLSRSVGLVEVGLLSTSDFEKIDALHYEVENKLLNLVQSLEHKKDTGTWTDTVAEDLADYEAT